MKKKNFLDLRDLKRENFVSFRPLKEEFVTVKTLELSDLSEITRMNQVELDEDNEAHKNLFKGFKNNRDLPKNAKFEITGPNSISLTIKPQPTYTATRTTRVVEYDYMGRNAPVVVEPGAQQEEEEIELPKEYTFQHPPAKIEENLEIQMSYNPAPNKPKIPYLRSGLIFMTPVTNQDQEITENGGIRYEPMIQRWAAPVVVGGEENIGVNLEKKLKFQNILKSTQGLPPSHQIFTLDKKEEKIGRRTLRHSLTDFHRYYDPYAVRDKELNERDFGVYNKRFKKVVLRANIFDREKLISQNRFKYETQKESSIVIRIDSMDSCNELLNDLVNFCGLRRLSGPNKNFNSFKVVEDQKSIIFNSGARYSLLCYNLSRREVKAIHFSSEFTDKLEFKGYQKDSKNDQLTIDLHLINLVIRRDEPPVLQLKHEILKDYSVSNFKEESTCQIRRKAPKDYYFTQDFEDKGAETPFEEDQQHGLIYHFHRHSLTTQTYYRKILANEKTQEIDFLKPMKNSVDQNKRNPDGTTSTVIVPASNDPIWIRSRNDLSEAFFRADEDYFIYFSGLRQNDDEGLNTVFRIRLPNRSDLGQLYTYRACFSAVYHKLFILRALDDNKEFGLHTIRLDDLSNFIRQRAEEKV